MKRVCVFLFLIITYTVCAEELIISVGVTTDSPLFHSFVQLFDEIEERSHGQLSFNIESMTLARCRWSLLNGRTDGDAGRTVFVYEGVSGILQINPPLFVNRYYAFGKPGLEIGGIESLRQYRMAVVKGNTIITKFTEQHDLRYTGVDENEDGLRMILFNRVDFILATDLEQGMLNNDEFREKALIMYDEEIFHENIYLFLSDRKADSRPLLEKILNELSESGELRRILGG